MKEAPTIILSIANGFAARALLRSGVLDALRAEARVVVLVPNADEDYLRAELQGVDLRPLPGTLTRVQDNFERRLWGPLTPSRRDADALVMEVIDRIEATDPRRYRRLRRWNERVSSRPWAVKTLRAVDRALVVRGGVFDGLFDELRPDLVVVTSAGYEFGNLALLRAARRRGVRTVNAVLSWDNLTTRGPMRERADRLIVWNELNRAEAVTLHGYAPDDVYVAGPPHFDVYARPERFAPWERYCERTGLDPSRRLIVLGGTTPDVTDGFDDIVRMLAEAIDRDAFGFPCQLLIRPHPIVFSGWTKGQGMREHIDHYLGMGNHVHFDIPSIRSSVLMADLAPEDSLHLAETLHHAGVVVNFFSTLMVDAAAAGTPIVCVGFDGERTLDYHSSVRRIKDITCIKNVLETGAVTIAEDLGALIAAISGYLAEPGRHADERASLTARMCHRIDGASADRYATRIDAFARGTWETSGSAAPVRASGTA